MHSPELGLAVLDSSLRLPEHRRPLLNDLREHLPARCSRVLALADARAESGTESILRWRLTEAGIPFVIQE
ncbi:hypothetical protein GCM10022256_11520 [Frondihabitans peucedani]|uniref:Uncharacterized protein n=2 Tax=Frondihabitans peucedani TaxID=598626 RepID=A0ABP8DZZ4_9MICO